MAAGSQATALRARLAAGYTTHNYQGRRCDGCAHCRPAQASFANTKKTRHCAEFRVSVLTHGACNRWKQTNGGKHGIE
jgi:hypothetical protein